MFLSDEKSNVSRDQQRILRRALEINFPRTPFFSSISLNILSEKRVEILFNFSNRNEQLLFRKEKKIKIRLRKGTIKEKFPILSGWEKGARGEFQFSFPQTRRRTKILSRRIYILISRPRIKRKLAERIPQIG